MTNTPSIRTLATLTAFIGLMMLALLTASGNHAEGQSLPSLEFTLNNISVDEPDQSEVVPLPRRPSLSVSQTSA